ncbi:MAG: GNAT family N-acetyltransferase [Spartobacteria bacterium]
MKFEIVPAHEISLAEQAATFTAAFDGYVGGSFEMDAAALARFICTQGADLCYSRFARSAEGLCGFGYISRTGAVARLAGMGVIAAARREGIARGLLLHLLAEAKTRGDRIMMLEVIEQNPPAYALYQREGFREVTRLCSWRRPANAEPSVAVKSAARISEIPLTSASQLTSAQEFPELPWPVSRHALAKMALGRAYASDCAAVVIGDPKSGAPVRVHGFLSAGPKGWDWAAVRQAFFAVLELHRGCEFFAPPVFPENYGGEIFLPFGFVKEPVSQFHMRYDL